MYCLVGSLVNRFCFGSTGLDILPGINLWKRICVSINKALNEMACSMSSPRVSMYFMLTLPRLTALLVAVFVAFHRGKI